MKKIAHLTLEGISVFYKSDCDVFLFRWFTYINLFFYIYHLHEFHLLDMPIILYYQ